MGKQRYIHFYTVSTDHTINITTKETNNVPVSHTLVPFTMCECGEVSLSDVKAAF